MKFIKNKQKCIADKSRLKYRDKIRFTIEQRTNQMQNFTSNLTVDVRKLKTNSRTAMRSLFHCGEIKKKISLLFQRYRKWNKKKRSQIHPRGRLRKMLRRKNRDNMPPLSAAEHTVSDAVRENYLMRIYVIARDSRTICGKLCTIYAIILFVASTSEIFSAIALSAKRIDCRARCRELYRAHIAIYKGYFFIRKFRG